MAKKPFKKFSPIKINLIGLGGSSDGSKHSVYVGDTFVVDDTTTKVPAFTITFNERDEITIRFLTTFITFDPEVLQAMLDNLSVDHLNPKRYT